MQNDGRADADMRIYVATKADAETLAVILLRSGYAVKIDSEKVPGKQKARTVVYATAGGDME